MSASPAGSHQTALIWDVIEPLFTWGLQNGEIDGLDICNLLCTCREAEQVIDWKTLHQIYIAKPPRFKWTQQQTPLQCLKCEHFKGFIHMPSWDESLCMHCQGAILVQDALKTFHLDHQDIQHLPRILVLKPDCFIPLPLWTCALDYRAVKSLALLKHGGPKALKEKLLPKRHHLSLQKACMKKIGKKMQELQIPDTPFLPKQVVKFIRRGMENDFASAEEELKRLTVYQKQILPNAFDSREKSILARPDFRQFLTETKTAQLRNREGIMRFWSRNAPVRNSKSGYAVFSEAPLAVLSLFESTNIFEFSHGIDLKMVWNESWPVRYHWEQFNSNFKKQKERTMKAERKKELTEALAKRGLKYRPDSRLCRDFVNGRNTDHTIKSVCDIMVEMDWLFRETNYKAELERLVAENKNPMKKRDEIATEAKCSILKTEALRRQNLSSVPESLRERLGYNLT